MPADSVTIQSPKANMPDAKIKLHHPPTINISQIPNGGFTMYYSNGNYEAFARPLKPEGVDNKTAWLVGSGLASLSAACFLIRDGQMKGENIHI